MNFLKKIFIPILSLFSLTINSGCTDISIPKLENELTFELNDITEISINYDDEDITFYESPNNDLIIKEYMSKNKKKYYAKVSNNNNKIHISEGTKPIFKGDFYRYIEVYLPHSYKKTLAVSTTNGKIDFSNIDINLNKFAANTTSGSVNIKNISSSIAILTTTSGEFNAENIVADNVKIETTSGNFDCKRLEGNVNYVTTSGSVNITSAYGYGQYKANNSGDINITYIDITDNLYLYNKNDDINLTIPSNLKYNIQCKSKNGNVSTPTNSSESSIKITAESVNGNINIKQ